jgi:uncharacterized protein (DUF849 family)
MKTLNKTASHILSRLIDAMNGKPHLKIYNEPFMPLTIECIGEAVNTPYGAGLPYSLCHYYEQNGDLLQDPEMCFIVVDRRDEEQHGLFIVAIPYMFQQANIGIYQESMSTEYGNLIMTDSRQQADHTDFANGWLANIRAQGFIKRKNDENTVQFSD